MLAQLEGCDGYTSMTVLQDLGTVIDFALKFAMLDGKI